MSDYNADQWMLMGLVCVIVFVVLPVVVLFVHPKGHDCCCQAPKAVTVVAK